jgi:hypothetical protein
LEKVKKARKRPEEVENQGVATMRKTALGRDACNPLTEGY